jgi:hypothetical protein
MKKTLVVVIFLFLSSLIAHSQDETVPEWVNTQPYMENGVLYFTGYSAPRRDTSMTYRLAVNNARSNLIRYLANTSSIEFPPIPADAEDISTFSISSTVNGVKVDGRISGIRVYSDWTDENGGFYILCTCTGVEVIRPETSQIQKSLEDMNPFELYMHSLELENQTNDNYGNNEEPWSRHGE